jgi:hypothetical protein
MFGLALTPPDAATPTALWAGLVPAQIAAAEDDLGDEMEEEEGGDSAGGGDMADYARTLRERADVISIHKPLGIATWISMTATVILGGIQYHNLYGLFSSQGSTPCDEGSAIFGQGQCSGTPWPHLISALMTTGLYGATFAFSLLMPDPDGTGEGESDYASNLRLHKLLRWVHFGGMIAQIALGVLVANADRFGLDRANDYGTLQALSTVHMTIGLVTWGALSWAALTML